MQGKVEYIPLFNHHKHPLNKQSLRDLRPDSLEQSEKSFVVNNKRHYFSEGLERLSIARRGWARLEAYFGDDQRLRG